MVTYKDRPGTSGEKYYRHEYNPLSAQRKITIEPEPSGNRFSQNNVSIESIIKMPSNNRFKQIESEKNGQYANADNYDRDYLRQPLWFDKIMQEIRKESKTEEKQPIQKQLYLFMN